MKKNYQVIECTIVSFGNQDVITASGFLGNEDEFAAPVPQNSNTFSQG